ncbi:arf-GAP with GTPase, ANK repeat and PH domain-containing protein 1-like protein [Anopheles sinensis]|uniref:Arf-GAP with GTPase, ANK repeat and PH domain-containing protein 1-like protein n=1 Tax=Anopheles sinensis TaxID=74873 RepID=A0A084WP46_ANOSI|nr:arf-GAP with GTPase, ANK repeat and PH domain-containing protein 1-like protein [Anopheles sinensis]
MQKSASPPPPKGGRSGRERRRATRNTKKDELSSPADEEPANIFLLLVPQSTKNRLSLPVSLFAAALYSRLHKRCYTQRRRWKISSVCIA